ncbi:hypothetical protein PAEPH01_1198 [Pancytospora epiphaga]|nr:hypothetical protein PAEPH01_1198 [Pancytospora epiphaga]
MFIRDSMEDEQRKPDSEQTKDTPVKTGKVVVGGTGDEAEESSANVPGPATSKMIALEALICGVKAPQCQWPGDVLKAGIDHFGRMPQSGLPLCRSFFCELFKRGIRLDELKVRTDSAITSDTGGKCSRKQFAEESTKRVKKLDTFLAKDSA